MWEISSKLLLISFLFTCMKLRIVNVGLHVKPSAVHDHSISAIQTTRQNHPLLSIRSVLPLTYFLGKQNFFFDLLVKVSACSVLSPPFPIVSCCCFFLCAAVLKTASNHTKISLFWLHPVFYTGEQCLFSPFLAALFLLFTPGLNRGWIKLTILDRKSVV